MSEKSRISVVIPVYDGERYLAEAIESVLCQSRPSFELLVVDDGSADGTAAVARGFGAAVVYLRQEHQGIGGALNHGLGRARGEWIALLDADDLWLPRKLELQGVALEQDPGLDLVYAQIQQFHSPELGQDFRDRIRCSPEPMAGRCPSCLLGRREAFDRVGPFAPRSMGVFIDWCARVEDLGVQSSVLPEVLARRRLHTSNFGLQQRAGRDRSYLHVLKAALDRRRGRT